MKADAKAEYDLSFTTENDELKVDGNLKGQGGFGLTAQLSAEAKANYIRWEAYAGAGILGAFMSNESQSVTSGLYGSINPVVLSDVSGYDWSGRMGFNGLALYYTFYAYAGVRNADIDKLEKSNPGFNNRYNQKKTEASGGVVHKKEFRNKVTLINDWSIPRT